MQKILDYFLYKILNKYKFPLSKGLRNLKFYLWEEVINI